MQYNSEHIGKRTVILMMIYTKKRVPHPRKACPDGRQLHRHGRPLGPVPAHAVAELQQAQAADLRGRGPLRQARVDQQHGGVFEVGEQSITPRHSVRSGGNAKSSPFWEIKLASRMRTRRLAPTTPPSLETSVSSSTTPPRAVLPAQTGRLFGVTQPVRVDKM